MSTTSAAAAASFASSVAADPHGAPHGGTASKSGVVKRVLRYKARQPYKEASPLRISTISAVSFLNADIDFRKLFERLPLVPKEAPGGMTGVFSMKHYDKSADGSSKLVVRGVRHCDSTGETHVATEVKKYFQNQITIIWTFVSSCGEVRTTNGFMFTNGKIKGVGLKCNEDITRSFRALRDYLQDNMGVLGDAVQIFDHDDDKAAPQPFECSSSYSPLSEPAPGDTTLLKLYGTRATMYNTDFSTHFQIIRDELFRIIIEDYTLEESEFEPDIYPAVKIKFAWNTDYLYGKHTEQYVPGVCYCENRCSGKGCGTGDGQCKVVTVCVFGNDAPNRHGGKIIITGANHYRQVEDVYKFMNTLLKTHYDQIVYCEPYMALETEE